MNDHGKVRDFSIECSNFTLDYEQNEVIMSLDVWYDIKALREITFTTNKNRTLTQGVHNEASE